MDYAEALAACRSGLLTSLTSTSAASSGQQLDWSRVGTPTLAAIKLYLPRFEVKFGTSLGQILQDMGVTAPFEGRDLTRITADGSHLAVSDVLHKVRTHACIHAFIVVDSSC